MQDLLKTPEAIPANIKEILDIYSFSETYHELEALKLELLSAGYSIDYDLNCEPFNLKKVTQD